MQDHNHIESPTAIISAMPFELSYLDKQTVETDVHTIYGKRYIVGKLNETSVVMTSNAGVGKVQCAIALMTLLERFKPRAIFMVGTCAGLNPSLNTGDVIVGATVAYHDRGQYWDGEFEATASWNASKSAQNLLKMPASGYYLSQVKQAYERKLVNLQHAKPKQTVQVKMDGLLITGDQIVADVEKRDNLREQWQADGLDMESAVVAEICLQHEIPFLVVRGVSDKAGDGATTAEEFQKYASLASENAGRLLAGMLEVET